MKIQLVGQLPERAPHEQGVYTQAEFDEHGFGNVQPLETDPADEFEAVDIVDVHPKPSTDEIRVMVGATLLKTAAKIKNQKVADELTEDVAKYGEAWKIDLRRFYDHMHMMQMAEALRAQEAGDDVDDDEEDDDEVPASIVKLSGKKKTEPAKEFDRFTRAGKVTPKTKSNHGLAA
jgi:hypothetical protein